MELRTPPELPELHRERFANCLICLLDIRRSDLELCCPVVQYSNLDLIEQEAPHEISASKPPPEWPETGAIEFKDLEMRYRTGLPNVLHGISMSIRGGEKIGIVGRTGAGKSSITLALLRIVKYSGSITIDG